MGVARSIFFVILFSAFFVSGQVSCGEDEIHTGEGTYYFIESFTGENGLGNCSFDHDAISPFYIGAMNSVDYDSASFCGACAEVSGPNGTSVTVKIIDQCPECNKGDVDLSPEAFEQLAPLIDGRINISWKVVPCDVTGNLMFHYKDGSNIWWTAVQVRNHKTQIQKLEFFDGVSYQELPRQTYNYFLKDDGMGEGPHMFRVTDIYGSQVEQGELSLLPEVEQNSEVQFPLCTVTNLNNHEEKQYFTVTGNTVSFDESVLGFELIDLKGQVLAHVESNNDFSLNTFPSGVYVFRVTLLEGVVSKKIQF